MRRSKNYGTFTQWNTMQLKGGTPTLHNSMGGTGEHYAKWSKPGSERNIPYDLTYKWNLISKTNKQAKYNQRHRNKGQTDSNQRGGRRAIRREGRGKVAKGMYEGPMEKAKVGQDWGWEMGGQGRVVGGKWRQPHLNNNKKNTQFFWYFL